MYLSSNLPNRDQLNIGNYTYAYTTHRSVGIECHHVFQTKKYSWWKKSGEHQLMDGKYPIIYRVSYMSGGDRRISEPSTVFGPPRTMKHESFKP